ncbi:amidase [Streptomyces sp. NBC_01506]|uniref:amidase n=1 Tax=Streptomyces sp. NBC_01506 TaxID=2903887 RepID=UPI00386FDB93
MTTKSWPLPLDPAADAELTFLRSAAATLPDTGPAAFAGPRPTRQPRLLDLPAPPPYLPLDDTGLRQHLARARRRADDTATGALVWSDWDISPTAQHAPLRGLTVGVKENIDVAGHPTRAGRAANVPPAVADAPVVTALRNAGALPVAGCAMTELAVCFDGNPNRPPVVNPLDPTLISGGSSSGSAVAVAAGLVDVALGTDTGGSVRVPAAACGVVGVKPTFGRMSRTGTVTLSPSLDHIGVIAPDVALAWAVLDILLGPDTDTEAQTRHTGHPGPSPQESSPDIRVGWPTGWIAQADPDIADRCREVLDACGSADVIEVDMPVAAETAAATNYLILAAEAAELLRDAVLADADTDPRVRSLVAAGSRLTPSEVAAAHRNRLALSGEFANAFADVDLIATPVLPSHTPRIGQTELPAADGRVLEWPGSADLFTAAANATGLPALSLPVVAAKAPPIGLQLIAPWGQDRALMRAAHLLERQTQAPTRGETDTRRRGDR